MNETAWLLAASLTFAASVHCVGMCGGLLIAVGAFHNATRRRRFFDHLVLQVGKAVSYAFLGTLAGLVGGALLANPAFRWGERALAILAGVALAAAGLTLLGVRRGKVGAITGTLAAAWSRIAGPLVSERPFGGQLVVGMAMGFLPCPLVYAGLAAAAASGSPGAGAAIMAGVALGTVPALTAVALVGTALPVGLRRGLVQAGGALLILMAVVTTARGLGLHAGHADHAGHAMGAAGGEHAGHAMPASPTPGEPAMDPNCPMHQGTPATPAPPPAADPHAGHAVPQP